MKPFTTMTLRNRSAQLTRLLAIGVFCILLSPISTPAQECPLGYISYFNNNAGTSAFSKTLSCENPELWSLGPNKKYTQIKPFINDSVPDNLFPQNRGILPNLILGEYILEFEFRLLDSPTNASAGFYFLSPVKSCDTYYAFGFGKDSLNFYYSANGILNKIKSEKLNVNTQEWTKIRIERNMLHRRISIKMDGNARQTIHFTDRRLVTGYLGFGTQIVNAGIRNISIWAPTAIEDRIYNCE